MDVVGSEGKPGGDDGAHVPGGVVDGGEGGTVLGVGQFGDEKWRGTVGNGDTETQEEASSDEHPEVDRDRLQDNTDHHDDAANEDTHPTSKAVGNVRGDWKRAEGADSHNAGEKTKERSRRVVEVLLPDVKSLKTVDHGPIVSVSCRGQDNKHQDDVVPSHARVFVPGDLGELAVRVSTRSIIVSQVYLTSCPARRKVPLVGASIVSEGREWYSRW